MARNRKKIISASEIGQYVYCNRAWWYGRLGHANSNTRALERGTRAHVWHGRGILALQWLAALAALLMIGGVVWAAFYFLALAAGGG